MKRIFFLVFSALFLLFFLPNRPLYAQKKEPGVAWARSFFLYPGAGQFYNGERRKGAVMLGVAIISAGVVVAASSAEGGDLSGTHDSTYNWVLAGAILLVTDWAWSWIDAPISAKRINGEKGYSGPIIIPGKNGAMLGYAIQF